MVRTPCCEKMGLKKGPWTPEEDRILISYIHQYGHHNWRAIPKQAGLLRCGKSCRLRWINYLRPDIKRGNFTDQEEQTIINLHQILGNRWSAMAARLPGRTDNEIKNFWNTHLKKKQKQKPHKKTSNPNSPTFIETTNKQPNIPINNTDDQPTQSSAYMEDEVSHPQSATQLMHTLLLVKDEDVGNNNNTVVASTNDDAEGKILLSKKSPTTPLLLLDNFMDINEDVDFWYNLFVETGDNHQG